MCVVCGLCDSDYNGDAKRPISSTAAAGVVSFVRSLSGLAHPTAAGAAVIRVNAVCTDIGDEKVAVQNVCNLLEDTKAIAAAFKITAKDGLQPILSGAGSGDGSTHTPATRPASASGSHHTATNTHHTPTSPTKATTPHHTPHGSGHHAPPGHHTGSGGAHHTTAPAASAGAGVTATGTPAAPGASGKTREAEEALIVQYLGKSKTIGTSYRIPHTDSVQRSSLVLTLTCDL